MDQSLVFKKMKNFVKQLEQQQLIADSVPKFGFRKNVQFTHINYFQLFICLIYIKVNKEKIIKEILIAW